MLKVNQLAIKQYLLSKGISLSEKQVNALHKTYFKLQYFIGLLLYPSDLHRLANQYEAGKPHWYLDIYDKHFKKLRNKKLNILEIGIGGYNTPKAGGGSLRMWQNYFPNSTILGVDLFVKNKFKLSHFSKSSQEIKFVDGSSYDDNTVNKVRQILGDRQFDLLFIDGDHNYEGVKKDFLKYRNLVREGGIIVFHDIVPDYFTRHGVKTGRWVGGVPIFWNEIKSLYQHWEFIENTDQDGLGIGVIQYSSKITFPEGDN
jgi:hypothetical protein